MPLPDSCQRSVVGWTTLDTAERCPRPNFGVPPTNNAVDSDAGKITDDTVRSIAIQRTVSRCDRPPERWHPEIQDNIRVSRMRASNRYYTGVSRLRLARYAVPADRGVVPHPAQRPGVR